MKLKFIKITLFSLIFFSTFIIINDTKANTEVSGIINSDTVWKIVNSPYKITNLLQVSDNATLTIEDGVEVRIAENVIIKIAGTLVINGTNSNPVILSPLSNNKWGGIEFINSINSQINNSIIENANRAIDLKGISEVSIVGNIFKNNTWVLTDTNGYQKMYFLNNTVHDNHKVFYGIRGDGLFSNNIFYNNSSIFDHGYYFGETVIKNNNFIDNNLVIKAPEQGYGYGTVDIANNWWGTTNNSDIDNLIIDKNDDVELQALNYFPIKTSILNNIGSSIVYNVPLVCTSWVYSDWGLCDSNGVQVRPIISKLPLNCIGGNAITTQLCQNNIEQKPLSIININKEVETNNTLNEDSQFIHEQTNIKNKSINYEVVKKEKSLVIKIDDDLSNRLKGSILLQVEKNGEAWYVYPDNKMKYYLGRPEDAFNIMKNLGLGIKHSELTNYLNSKFPSRLFGKILLDVEQNGEAYYINPENFKGYFLNRPEDAFRIMREVGLGITNENLRKIEVGDALK